MKPQSVIDLRRQDLPIVDNSTVPTPEQKRLLTIMSKAKGTIETLFNPRKGLKIFVSPNHNDNFGPYTQNYRNQDGQSIFINTNPTAKESAPNAKATIHLTHIPEDLGRFSTSLGEGKLYNVVDEWFAENTSVCAEGESVKNAIDAIIKRGGKTRFATSICLRNAIHTFAPHFANKPDEQFDQQVLLVTSLLDLLEKDAFLWIVNDHVQRNPDGSYAGEEIIKFCAQLDPSQYKFEMVIVGKREPSDDVIRLLNSPNSANRARGESIMRAIEDESFEIDGKTYEEAKEQRYNHNGQIFDLKYCLTIPRIRRITNHNKKAELAA